MHDETANTVAQEGSRVSDSKPARTRPAAASLLERIFEGLLWNCRFAVLVAVASSILISLGLFYTVTVDSIEHLRHIPSYATEARSVSKATEEEQEALTTKHERARSASIARVVEAIDGYLLATVMLIFGFGLYELFISRLAAAENDARTSRILQIHSLDDLKQRLGQVILLILVVKFFEHALRVDFATPITLLWYAVAIALVSGALYLAHRGSTS